MAGAPVLVTRAEPGATRTCARLEALGFRVVNSATAQIRPSREPLDLTHVTAIALTSPNGADALARLTADRARPVFAVGDVTAEAARAAGFKTVASANGDVDALARLILDDAPPGPVLHVRGRDQAGDLVATLARAGRSATALAAYAAEPVESLPAEAVAALESDAIVLVHSAKGAERFLALARRAGVLDRVAAVRAAAISDAAAAPLRQQGLRQIAVAEHPGEDHLIEALTRLAP